MHRSRIAATTQVAATLVLLATHANAENENTRLEALEARLEQILEQNARMQAEILRLGGELREVRSEASPPAAAPPIAATPAASAPGEGAMFSGRIGRANVLADISLDVLAAAGGSSARDEELELLQGGEHDPRQRGFTFQQAELSFMGAVDPYLNGEAHLVFFVDTEGESQFELEEAFAQTVALPFGLHEQGLQLEAGYFFTEFGRINPVHPHAWDWQDQPFVLTRFFGGDGSRAAGARAGWMLPLPWFSELHLGVQNAKGETMVSFLASDEVFEERPIGGRPFASDGVHGLSDLVYLIRSTHGFDFSDEISGQLGGSVLLGPNATGKDGDTRIFGGDLVLKWRPLNAERGWPFVELQGEFLYRRYDADAFSGCFEETTGCTLVALPSRTLDDYGGYAQALWGFRRGWATGLRYEYGSGRGSDVAFDEASDSVIRVSRSEDPFRSPRHRISPLVVYHPSEFARVRLQYNYDRQRFLKDHDEHSVWAGIEFSLGSHPAHSY
jgi:hypothetical protein